MPFLDRVSGGLSQARAQQAFAARNAAPNATLQGRNADSTIGRDFYQPVAAPLPPVQTGVICGAPGCSSGWLNAWKKRRRPYFEEEWACSGRCLQALVRAAVRREVGDNDVDRSLAPHRHRVPLGLVLLAQGWITHAQLQTALEAQRAGGQRRIGDWLVERCGIPAERVTRGLGVQWNCPVLSLEGFSPAAMALVMPPPLAVELDVVPVRTAGKRLLYLAFEGSMNAAGALAVERMSGLPVESGLLGERDFAQARAAIQQVDAVPLERSTVPHQDALCEAIARAIEQRQPVASRMVRIKNFYWLRLWLESGARMGIGDLPPDSQDVEDHLFSIASIKSVLH